MKEKPPRVIAPEYVSGIPMDKGDAVAGISIQGNKVVVATKNGRVFLIDLKGVKV